MFSNCKRSRITYETTQFKKTKVSTKTTPNFITRNAFYAHTSRENKKGDALYTTHALSKGKY